MRNFIPDKLYGKIQKILPIVCVDLIIKTERGVLFGIRDQEPAKGERWIIGGRVLYGESLEDAVKRKAVTEAGLKVQIIRQVGAYSMIFRKGEKRHSISIVYLVKKRGGKLRLNDEYSGHVFLKHLDKKLHPYLLTVLNDSNVFKKYSKTAKRGHFN
jgi:colanic acid biosynthesis protein WcaH